MSRYWLSAHSYVCIADEHAVFLDLRKDKYSALGPADARTLSGVVDGWLPGREIARDVPTRTRGCDELVRTLLEERLLTSDMVAGKPATPVSIVRPTLTLQVPPRRIPRVDRTHVSRFVAAWLLATTMLNTVPLKATVGRVWKRKARRSGAEGAFDVKRAFGLMTAYSILRPNFFSRRDACLRDSFTVVEFLARYGVFPTWVFGVRMNPFAAHSWVQEGSIVINDDVDHVNTFTPILTI